jgi:hypothetical protein
MPAEVKIIEKGEGFVKAAVSSTQYPVETIIPDMQSQGLDMTYYYYCFY